ncbi:MAG TPA: SIS domain-containing protein [Micrococcaceae bacterium]|nr:SIS domain-containing protein [Micrococcaceae bacterium]
MTIGESAVDSLGRDSVEEWLRSLLPAKGLGSSAQQVFNLIAREPAKASFLPAAELAALAQTSISSVTRAAQRLGYEGWPDFQRDLRARHLAHLSMIDVSDAHQGAGSPYAAALRQDAESLAVALRNSDESRIKRIAGLIARSDNIYVTAQGSFSAVGQALVHNVQIAGYPARELLDRPAAVSNHVSRMTPRDVLIVCSYWRLYDVAVTAAAQAQAHGAKVVILTDNISPALERCADEIVITPAEGSSFFPSLTAAMAVQQGIVATLAFLDPERTRRNLIAVEEGWREFKLLHRSVPSIRPNI